MDIIPRKQHNFEKKAEELGILKFALTIEATLVLNLSEIAHKKMCV